MDNKRSKSFEEREEEYEKARARIFNQDSLDILLLFCSNPTMQEGYGESPYSRSQDGTLSSSRRSSQEDLRWVGEPRPWSSTDSDSSGRKEGGGGSFDCEGTSSKCTNVSSKPVQGGGGASKSDSEASKDTLSLNYGARPTVITKASSFGGISVLSREGPVCTKNNKKLSKSESLNMSPVSSSVSMTPAAEPTPKTAPAPPNPTPTPPLVLKVANQMTPDPAIPTVALTETKPCCPSEQQPLTNVDSHQRPNSNNDSSQSGKLEMKESASAVVVVAEGTQTNNPNQNWICPEKETKAIRNSPPPSSSSSSSVTSAPTTYLESYQFGKSRINQPQNQSFVVAPVQSLAPATVHSHLPVVLNGGGAGGGCRQQSQSPLSNLAPSQASRVSYSSNNNNNASGNGNANPSLVYIPCVTSQVPTVLSHQQGPMVMTSGHQMQQHYQNMHNSNMYLSQGQFIQDGVNASDLVGQMSSLNFGPGQGALQSHLHHHHHPGMGPAQSAPNGIDFAKMSSIGSQPFFVPSDKGQGFTGGPQQQPPAAQVPFYYIQHLTPNMGLPTMRYVCPSQSLATLKGAPGASVTGAGAATATGGGGGAGSAESSESPNQAPSPHLSGHPFLPPGYSLLTVAQNPENVGYTTVPYFSYAVPSASANGPPSSSNASLLPHPPPLGQGPPNPNSVPIYPFGNLLLASNGNSLLGPPHHHHHHHHHNSSHLNPHHPAVTGGPHFGPHGGAPRPSLGAPMPLCVMTNGTGSALHCPQPSQGGHNPAPSGSSTYALSFRAQTPPSQASNGAGGGPNNGNMQNAGGANQQSAPFISYAFYSPPMHQPPHNANSGGAIHSAAGGGGPNSQNHPSTGHYTPQQQHNAHQSPLLHPSFLTSFHVLKPSIPAMSNLRNSTPPPPPLPSLSQQSQQQTPIPANQQSIIPSQLTSTPHQHHHSQTHLQQQQQHQQHHHHQHQQPHQHQQQQQPNHHMKSNSYLYSMGKNTAAADHHGGMISTDSHPINKGVNANLKSGRMSGPLHIGPPPVRLPNSGPMYRRGLPLLQDVRLLGHPLQQQMNPLLFQQQPPRGGGHVSRFPPPAPAHFPSASSSPSASNISHQMGGQANLTSRSPKPRKQRNRWPPGGQQVSGVLATGANINLNNTAGKNSPASGSTMYTDDSFNRGNHLLAVEGLPDGMKRSEVERYLEQVTNHGAKIQFSITVDGGNNAIPGYNPGNDFIVNISKHRVYALFESETAAQSALLNIKTPKFMLRSSSTSNSTSSTSSSSSSAQQTPQQHQHFHHPSTNQQQQQQHRNSHHQQQQQQHNRNHHHHHHHHQKDGSANKSLS